METFRSARIMTASALVAGLLTACASGIGRPVLTPSPEVAPSDRAVVATDQSRSSQQSQFASVASTDERIAIKVYFLMHDPRELEFLVPVHRSVAQTDAVAAAAMGELLAGPSTEEQSGNYKGPSGRLTPLSTAVPRGTELLGIDIRDGIAMVDLSREFGSGSEIAAVRQAQVVYTLTQFPTVKSVEFRIDGEPMAVIEGHEGTASSRPGVRNLYFDQRRPVFVDQPAWGALVGDTVLVSGETTRDAELRIALINGAADSILAERTIRAACDPCMAPDAWGPFEARLSIPAGPRPTDLRLRIWEPAYGEGGATIVVDYLLGWNQGEG